MLLDYPPDIGQVHVLIVVANVSTQGELPFPRAQMRKQPKCIA